MLVDSVYYCDYSGIDWNLMVKQFFEWEYKVDVWMEWKWFWGGQWCVGIFYCFMIVVVWYCLM